MCNIDARRRNAVLGSDRVLPLRKHLFKATKPYINRAEGIVFEVTFRFFS